MTSNVLNCFHSENSASYKRINGFHPSNLTQLPVNCTFVQCLRLDRVLNKSYVNLESERALLIFIYFNFTNSPINYFRSVAKSAYAIRPILKFTKNICRNATIKPSAAVAFNRRTCNTTERACVRPLANLLRTRFEYTERNIIAYGRR